MDEVKYLPIINKSDSWKLELSDICYINRMNRKLAFETDSGTVETYEKIDDVLKYLGPEFFRCMSGCIVNISRIKRIKKSYVYFDNGKCFRLSRDPYIRLKQRFNAYLRNLVPGSGGTDDPEGGKG